MFIDYLDTPIGVLEIEASTKAVTKVVFTQSNKRVTNSNEITDSCKQQLVEYFNGERKTFELSLQQQGTDFQKLIWNSLKQIAYGKTVSYGYIATKINNPKAVRAVGAANGKNLIGIIVPCHRVIGSNGTLTGYAGGLDRKAWLLKHEGIE